MMKGKNPKSPRPGAQEEEKSKKRRGFSARMGRLRRYRPTIIRKTMRLGKKVKKSMAFEASASLSSLTLPF